MIQAHALSHTMRTTLRTRQWDALWPLNNKTRFSSDEVPLWDADKLELMFFSMLYENCLALKWHCSIKLGWRGHLKHPMLTHGSAVTLAAWGKWGQRLFWAVSLAASVLSNIHHSCKTWPLRCERKYWFHCWADLHWGGIMKWANKTSGTAQIFIWATVTRNQKGQTLWLDDKPGKCSVGQGNALLPCGRWPGQSSK